jgi:hypothetical protein
MTSVLAPAIAFIIAASIGIVIRKRSAKEDRRYRELNFSS